MFKQNPLPPVFKANPNLDMKTKTKVTKAERELKQLEDKLFIGNKKTFRFCWYETLEGAKRDKQYKKLSEKEKQQIARYFELSDKHIASLTKKALYEIGRDNYEFLHQDDHKYGIKVEKHETIQKRNEKLLAKNKIK